MTETYKKVYSGEGPPTEEVSAVLDTLPRMTPNSYPKTTPNAWVYIDAIGDLNILPLTGGLLKIDEEDLYVIDSENVEFSQ